MSITLCDYITNLTSKKSESLHVCDTLQIQLLRNVNHCV